MTTPESDVPQNEMTSSKPTNHKDGDRDDVQKENILAFDRGKSMTRNRKSVTGEGFEKTKEDIMGRGKIPMEEMGRGDKTKEEPDRGDTAEDGDKAETEQKVEEKEDYGGIPTDGGWAWVFCAACFVVHVLVVGGVKSTGVIFVEIQDKYDVTAREIGVALGGAMCMLLGMGVVANTLAAKFSTRSVVFTGGIFAGVGFILTAFVASYGWIYLTYTLITGFGFSLTYAPSLVKVGCHFRKHRSLANGLAVSGSGVGSFVLPILIRLLLNEYGLWGCLLILGSLMFHLCIFALLLRPLSSYRKPVISSQQNNIVKESEHSEILIEKHNMELRLSEVESLDESSVFLDSTYSTKYRTGQRQANDRDTSVSLGDLTLTSLQSIAKEDMDQLASNWRVRSQNFLCCRKDSGKVKTTATTLFDWSLMKNSVFLVYLAACFLANMGYANVFLILPTHAEMNDHSRDMSALLLSIMGITDLIGRIFFGWLSDRNFYPKRYSFIGSLALSGMLNIIAPALTSFPAMAVYVAFYGFFSGCYFALIAVLLAEALGTERLGSSLGLVLLGMAIGVLISVPICGGMKDITHDWTAAFLFCGVTTLVAAAFPLLVPCAQRREDTIVGAEPQRGHHSGGRATERKTSFDLRLHGSNVDSDERCSGNKP